MAVDGGDVKRYVTPARVGIISARVIRTFRSRALRRYFEAGDVAGLGAPNVGRIGRMLRALDALLGPNM